MSKRKRNDDNDNDNDNDSSENESKEDVPHPLLEDIQDLSPMFSPNHNFNPDEPSLLLEHGLIPVAAAPTATASGVVGFLELPVFPDSEESDSKKVEDTGRDLMPAARTNAEGESKEEDVDSDADKKPAAREDRDRTDAPEPPIDPQGVGTAFDLEDNGAPDSLRPTRGVPPVARLPSAETVSTPGRSEARVSADFSYLEPTQEELDREKNERAKEGVKSWYRLYNDLLDFKRSRGNCNVPQKFKENKELGSWVNKQRESKKLLDKNEKSGMLTAERKKLLDDIGFSWAITHKGDEAWQKRYDELLEYMATHNGSVDIPTKYRANKALGRWVSSQRSIYKLPEKERTNKTQARIDKLDAIGFRWTALASPGAGEEEEGGGDDEEEEDEDDDDDGDSD